ncbi:NAD-dependent epimerase/dehydratase family protein [Leucobacter sp. USHLN153]|uniref:NAD-dependent epimerase/dehydratase family protein n=1 Tax=Leucobacter sp. USHLN153 TaxID=3081268 RepID=UPI003019DBA7
MRTQVVNDDIARVVAEDLPWFELQDARVLVTGANGMIPSVAVLALLEANRTFGLNLTVYALVRNAQRTREIFDDLFESPALVVWEQDVTAPLPTTVAMTHIIHGASAAQPKKHATDPVGTLNANLRGTQNLLDAAVSWGSRSFVLMSSAEIYGDTSGISGMISEDDYGTIDILSPRACYSEGKRASETIAAVYSHQYGISYTAARFGHVYGPGLRADDGRVQADFAGDVLAGRDIVLQSAGLAQRTYTYVSDAVTGLFTAMLRGSNGAFNVADASGLVTIRGLAETFVSARAEKHLQLQFDQGVESAGTSPIQFLGLDSAKLRALGWNPRVPLDEGVDRFLTHLEQQSEPAA